MDDEVFWLDPGRLAGRCGPNKTPWEPHALARSGFAAILSVNNGDDCDAVAIEAAGLRYACIPMSDNAPPQPGDIEVCLAALPRALDWVRRHREHGPVLVHCRSGKDRTGLFMAWYLMHERGLDAEAAIAEVRRVRPIAFTADGWLAHCQVILGRVCPTLERSAVIDIATNGEP